MKMTLPVLLALLFIVPAAPAIAGQLIKRDTGALHAEQWAQQRVLTLRNQPHQKHGNMAYVVGQGLGGENGPYANPYRTYPPSCMADPLPATATGPQYQQQIDMASYNRTLGGYVREPVTLIIWRVPCSSSQRDNAITLMRIQRTSEHEGDSNQYVVFPGTRVLQGSVGFDDPSGFDLPRIALEPNTIVSLTSVDAAMVDSTTYVLEDYPLSDRPAFDYSQAFSMRLDNFINDNKAHRYYINVPDYSPNSGTYPTAGEVLPINGYMTNSYYDPGHSGEGMMVQIYELSGSGQYVLQFNWFTFGANGRPYWISGDARFQPGARMVAVTQAGYLDNGGFANDFGSAATPHFWGTITFQWNDCNHMQFSYQAQGLPAEVPQGKGTLVWSRLANANGLACE